MIGTRSHSCDPLTLHWCHQQACHPMIEWPSRTRRRLFRCSHLHRQHRRYSPPRVATAPEHMLSARPTCLPHTRSKVLCNAVLIDGHRTPRSIQVVVALQLQTHHIRTRTLMSHARASTHQHLQHSRSTRVGSLVPPASTRRHLARTQHRNHRRRRRRRHHRRHHRRGEALSTWGNWRAGWPGWSTARSTVVSTRTRSGLRSCAHTNVQLGES